jgi:regulator of sirC expression with transglutaminase-like and TPR domain
MTSPARRRFRAIAQLPDDQINLAEAALCIAWEDQGEGNPSASLRRIDALAATAQERIAGRRGSRAIVAALNVYLFDELGFRGNFWDYSDPGNSFLDQVITRRVGLPILLSVLYLEIGWRLHLPVVGLALPGHFLVRYVDQQNGDLYISIAEDCGRWRNVSDRSPRLRARSIQRWCSRSWRHRRRAQSCCVYCVT